MKKPENSKAQKWMLVIYFVFCFYYFGVVMMTYFVSYPQLQKISKNIFEYMQLFNDKMLLFFKIFMSTEVYFQGRNTSNQLRQMNC